MQKFFFSTQKINKNKIFFSKILFLVILSSNFLPVFSINVLAEGEETLPVETSTEITPADTQTVDPAPVSTETQTQEAQVAQENLPIENISTTTEITQATSTGTTTPEVNFSTTSTTTLSTTTETHQENLANASTTEIIDGTDNTDQQVLINNTEGEGLLPNTTTVIDTGDAVATANLLNVVNTNSINSTGTIQMVNLPEGYKGDLDLRPSTNNISSSVCNIISCGNVENISAKIQSDASIDNALVLQANTGDNAVATVGGGIINTGEAKTGLNLVNLANTNIIDSNYFVLTLNSFKDINGDIVLPSLTEFLNSISKMYLDNANINTSQNAEIVNDMNVQANAGENSTENSLNSYTKTGDSLSLTNVYNNINSNLFGGKSISILLKVTGNWIGRFLGLPDGVQMAKDGDLYTLQIDDGVVTAFSPANLDFFATSTAQIHNNIDMLSNSGNNKIQDTNQAIINTGDAVSVANIVNIANTNIVGKKWILAIINIFGDFNGDISFGRPDIFVEQSALSEGVLQNDSILDYKIFVQNKGDVNATFVRVLSEYDIPHLEILEANQPYVFDENGNLAFNLGDLAPKEIREINFKAKVKNTIQGQEIKSIVTAYLQEKDNNLSDNTNIFSINTYAPNFVGNFYNQQNILPNENNYENDLEKENFQISVNNFLLVRANPEIFLDNSNSNLKAHQKIVLRNLSNKVIPNVIFHDILYDQNGQELRRETWDLGDIKGKEEIELEYNISFADSAEKGNYWLTSEVEYSQNEKIFFNNNGKVTLQKEKVKDLSYLFIPATQTIVNSSANLKILEKSRENKEDNKEIPKAEIISTQETQIATNNLFDPANIHYSIPLVISSVISSLYMFTYKKREEE